MKNCERSCFHRYRIDAWPRLCCSSACSSELLSFNTAPANCCIRQSSPPSLGFPCGWRWLLLTQLIGGVLLILGALTPLAALGIAGTMIPATIFLIQRGEPFINPAGHSWENSAFYLMAGICLALSGAGRWSADAWLFGRKQKSVDTDRLYGRSIARQKP
jgi:uncharacterized membrane protein YphA (DoxX/SURF4 family)